ncbi:ROK family protein [Chelativorans sp.]|uniref:ROK family protein n=1 Tax=Chelativorans sp. TaxID=2203393 RepID=UPI00281210ED|nr:ROK family protein [Chelativorans sp.]
MEQAAALSERQRRALGRPRTIEAGQASLSLVLNLIREGRATTRHELERSSELGRAVIADRIAALMDLGLLREGELGPATGGRAPRHMRFRADAGSILVSAIDQSSIAVGVADLSGRLLFEHHEAADLAEGPEAILGRLAMLFAWMMEEGDRPAPWGIGLAMPGAVEKTGVPFAAVPVMSSLQSWSSYPFVERLITRLGAPVWVRSGVQSMTMGEFKAGAGQPAPDMIYVKLGRSISAGLISEGRLHRGAEGATGMIGHTRIGDAILEAVAGADALSHQARTAAKSGESRYLTQALERQGDVSVVDVGHGAQLGDIFCVELLTRCGRMVGEALAPLANMLNPSLIVIGGVVAETGDSLLAGIREAVYRLSHPLVTRDLRIVRSQMGASSGLVGAAQVVIEELFSPTLLQGWITQGSPLRHPDFLALHARLAPTDPGQQP